MAARYRKELLLGTGGMAEVWRARGPSGVVAIKRLLPHAARNPSLAAAFEREGRLLARISHPNIVAIHEVACDDEGGFLVLEYVEGADLRTLSAEPVTPRLALRVARDVLDALDAVHGLCDENGRPIGLIHRDLSPSNVLVGLDGRVKLTDFGIARALSGSHATTGQNIKGTLAYVSPEQATGAPVDARSDLFAVGALLYEMLSAAPIYDEDDPRVALARARAGDVGTLGAACPGLPVDIVQMVDHALAAVASDRFPTARAMLDELVRVAQRTVGLATDAELGTWVAKAGARQGEALVPGGRRASWIAARRWPAWLAVLAGLAASVVLVVWLARRAVSTQGPPAELWTPASASARVAAQVTAGSPEVAPGVPAAGPEARAEGAVRKGEAAKDRTKPAVGHVTASGAAAAAADPRQEPGLLDIGSEPAFAYVAIDGVRVGPTPQFGREVAPGMHRIEVSREGLGSKTIIVDVHPGERVRRVVKLP